MLSIVHVVPRFDQKSLQRIEGKENENANQATQSPSLNGDVTCDGMLFLSFLRFVFCCFRKITVKVSYCFRVFRFSEGFEGL